ncbi:hypothetical protein ABOB24_26040, partial [Escherichia coli]
LIALAVAASAAVSCSAMGAMTAFSESNINNTINFGGTVTPQDEINPWVWAAGQGYDKFRNKLSDLTNDSTRLVMNADEYMPILVGKTSQAMVGREGVTPSISLADANGKVQVKWIDNSKSAGVLGIAVNGSDGTQIGRLTFPVTGGGVIAHAANKGDGTIFVSIPRMGGTVFGDGQGSVFNGANYFSDIDLRIASYGGPAIRDLFVQLANYNDALRTPDNDLADVFAEDRLANPHAVYSVAYALGIPVNEQIVLDFNQKLSSETVWNAPLTVQVTYQ